MYNPSDPGRKGTIFGLPYSTEEADLVLLPVNLDVTVSYADGTSVAPQSILEESSQLDLSLLSTQNPWELKMSMGESVVLSNENELHREKARSIIEALESGGEVKSDELKLINKFCESVHGKVERLSTDLHQKGKFVGVIGGDHSSPLGLIRTLAQKHQFGILQIDAHMDLRESYEGFTYSHASIMFNALKEEGVVSLTQVGIRDFCEEEELYVANSAKQINVFYDEQLFQNKMEGVSWADQAKEIIKSLPEKVYISFDVDGLDPSLCPNTGTPVPSGLGFNETVYLLEQVAKSGRIIIGFDLCETGNNAWDANVAARILYRLATVLGLSNGLLKFRN